VTDNQNKNRRAEDYKDVQDASPVLASPGCAKPDGKEQSLPKSSVQPRGEKTSNRRGLNIGKHSVFVLDKDGKPLTPTTPARARKLLKGNQAKKVWSKFGTFGIQMLVEVGTKTPQTIIGVDHGTKYEGYSIVVDQENNLNVKLDLPDKFNIKKKMEKRRERRKFRRHRKSRRRSRKTNKSSRKGFIAPSQNVIIQSRLKVIRELIRIYPITIASIEKA
jgi:hypothetical protein